MIKKITILLLLSTGLQAQQYSSEFVTPDAVNGGASSCNLLTNCSFESGDTTGWVINDLTTPFLPVQAVTDGADIGFGFFLTEATEGLFSAVNGFDGDGPGAIELAQDVTLPSNVDSISFDYRAAWDLQTFGATIDRTFSVQIQPSGGGAAMQSDLLLTAAVGELITDTGALSANIDVSAFAGQSVRFSLVWDIPEPNSGPAFFQVDNFVGGFQPPVVPTLNTYSMLFMGVIILAVLFLFRKNLSI